MGKIMLNEISYSGGGGNADIVRLTQAEYDALPSSKLTDDKVYMITDANGDGSQFQPIIYSENEREIGVWVDGKPLYEKTVTFSNVSKSGKAYFGIANSDTIFLKDGYITEVDTMFPYVHGTASANNIGGFIRKEQNNSDAYWEFRGGNDAPSTLSGWMSVRYTKTTDTAGSGTWTPQGVPAVHYSTDEQVIGTWIDGSTLYEKTIILSTPLSMNAYSWGTVSTLTEQINIVSAEGIYNTGTEYAFYPIGANCDTNKELTILNYRNVQNSINIIILRYTKTTS